MKIKFRQGRESQKFNQGTYTAILTDLFNSINKFLEKIFCLKTKRFNTSGKYSLSVGCFSISCQGIMIYVKFYLIVHKSSGHQVSRLTKSHLCENRSPLRIIFIRNGKAVSLVIVTLVTLWLSYYKRNLLVRCYAWENSLDRKLYRKLLYYALSLCIMHIVFSSIL